jgi:hypothetical protein
MATYFVGGELDSAVLLGSVGVTENAGAGAQSGFTRGGIRVEPQGAPGFACYLINPTTGLRAGATGRLWLHFNAWIGGANNTDRIPLTFWNAAGVQVFRMAMAGSNVWRAQVWSGSAWVNVGPTFDYKPQNWRGCYVLQ